MSELKDRLPPHNRDAERGVLGGVLRDPHVLSDVLAVVRPDAMYFDCHRRILEAITGLAARSAPVDLVSLRAELVQGKHLEDAGGVAYLAELYDVVPTGANAVYHAKLVREDALTRALIHICNEALRDAYGRTGPAEELIARYEQKLFALNTDTGGDAEPVPIGDAVRESLNELDAQIADGDELTGLSYGYADLDRCTGGLQPGEVVVFAARPSVGKTAGSMNIARNVALAGHRVLFFSLEQSRREIASRMLAMQSGVPMQMMSRPKSLEREDIDALWTAGAAPGAVLASLPLEVYAEAGMTAAQVAAVARRACRRRGVRLIVVDYLGMMSPENPRDNKALQIGTLALRMKNLARALGVPLILLCQLNRESEHERRRPRLSDLRDSGEIEQHADRVFLLHREPNLPATDPVWPIDVIVAKNRNGPTGDFTLALRRAVMRFENAAV